MKFTIKSIWKSISNGAKRLYKTAKDLTPKFRTGTKGTVQVFGGPANQYSSMMNTDLVAQGLKEGTIQASQLGTKQTLGSAEGWFTKAGSTEADKLVTQTINNAMESNVNMLQGNSQKYFNDLVTHQKEMGSYVNNSEAFDTVVNNTGTNYNGITDFDGAYNSDLGMTGDYKLINPNEPTSYSFTGDRTFDNPVAKKYNYKKHIKRAKKATLGWAKDSLLAVQQDDIIQPDQGDFLPTQGAEFAGSIGASLSATDIKGATGSSSYANVFGDAAWEKLRAYHKHMNYQGST